MQTFYMIASVDRLQYLPNPTGSRGKGGTHVEPEHWNSPWPPRLFNLQTAAKRSLNWWLKGKIEKTISHGSWEFGEEPEVSYDTVFVPERKPEDWEVIPVDIIDSLTSAHENS